MHSQKNNSTTPYEYLSNNKKPLLLAHRGSRILGPENTFEAFDIAHEAQADALEIDIRLSRDKTLLVFHDETLERVTNGFGKITDHTLIQLKHFDAAYHFKSQDGEAYRGRLIRLPTLGELFEAYPYTRINIDIKDKNPLVAELLVECITHASAEKRVLVGSFHQLVITHFRQIAPEIPTAASPKEVSKFFALSHTPIKKTKIDSAALQIPSHFGWLNLSSKRFINLAKRSNKPIHYWTINTSEEIRRLLTAGADGIVTDRIDLALPIFQEMGFK